MSSNFPELRREIFFDPLVWLAAPLLLSKSERVTIQLIGCVFFPLARERKIDTETAERTLAAEERRLMCLPRLAGFPAEAESSPSGRSGLCSNNNSPSRSRPFQLNRGVNGCRAIVGVYGGNRHGIARNINSLRNPGRVQMSRESAGTLFSRRLERRSSAGVEARPCVRRITACRGTFRRRHRQGQAVACACRPCR